MPPGKIGSMDHLTCIDFEGNKLWQVAYGKSWDQSYPNTRSTPTIEEDRIYIISGVGELGLSECRNRGYQLEDQCG